MRADYRAVWHVGPVPRVGRRRSIALLEERLVEEADDPLLILPRPFVEAADMFCLVDPPDRLRFRGGLEIIGVQLLAAPSVGTYFNQSIKPQFRCERVVKKGT